ncbi:hypothetical protein LIER_06421 [Lithospermum erythrorhizon]|uniref:Protein yippee-like n=1 Tax=Lithospermum erythrorhizon TaxID=34254 RepID=A0AAV3P4J1_LITER
MDADPSLIKVEQPREETSGPSLIEFEQTRANHFFLCSKCRTHIVLSKATKWIDPVANERFFEDEVVNVKVAGEDKKWQENSRTYVEVFCLGCENVLGKQTIAVESENVISKKGRYCLSLPKLIMWDGIRLLYAHSCQPVYDDPSSLKNSSATDDEQETTSS